MLNTAPLMLFLKNSCLFWYFRFIVAWAVEVWGSKSSSAHHCIQFWCISSGTILYLNLSIHQRKWHWALYNAFQTDSTYFYGLLQFRLVACQIFVEHCLKISNFGLRLTYTFWSLSLLSSPFFTSLYRFIPVSRSVHLWVFVFNNACRISFRLGRSILCRISLVHVPHYLASTLQLCNGFQFRCTFCLLSGLFGLYSMIKKFIHKHNKFTINLTIPEPHATEVW